MNHAAWCWIFSSLSVSFSVGPRQLNCVLGWGMLSFCRFQGSVLSFFRESLWLIWLSWWSCWYGGPHLRSSERVIPRYWFFRNLFVQDVVIQFIEVAGFAVDAHDMIQHFLALKHIPHVLAQISTCWRDRWSFILSMARTPGMETACRPLWTFFYKMHNNLVTNVKTRYLSKASDGPGVTDPTLFSITIRMHTQTEIFFFPQDNCNLEWTYNWSCLCGDSWWI